MKALDSWETLLMTFQYPRKSYLDSWEFWDVGALWRQGQLSAGESGEDDNGQWQMFSLTDDGRARVDVQAADD